MYTDAQHQSANFLPQQPNVVSIQTAEDLARRSSIGSPELDRAIEAKVGHEQLGEPEGSFYPLEAEEVTVLGATPRAEHSVVRVGELREIDGRIQVGNAHRELGSIGSWRFGANFASAHASSMTGTEAAHRLGAMKYSEIGRFVVVGENLVARLTDGKLVLAPDTSEVRSSFETAHFKPYGSTEIDDEYGSLVDDTWGGFSLDYVPSEREVPIQPANNGHYEVNTEWRKVKAEWRKRDSARTAQAVGEVGLIDPTRVYSAADIAAITGNTADGGMDTRTQVIPVVKIEDRFPPTKSFEVGDMSLNEVTMTAHRAVDEVAKKVGRVLNGMVGLRHETDVAQTFQKLDADMAEVVIAALVLKVGRGDSTDPEIKQAAKALALIRQIQETKN